ncbi:MULTISPECIES: hypothetical protein [unclassified Micromonospora]|uniref:hypothetical protein n=1 Tax=unclassified Micromonospora TaxID=2617518 RepID=UPI003628A942
MQSAAFARPFRPATLRGARLPWQSRLHRSRHPRQSTLRRIGELGRLALTALVLAVGVGGVAALPAPAFTAAPVAASVPAPASAAAPVAASTAAAVGARLTRPVVVASRAVSLVTGTGATADPVAPQARAVPGGARRPAPAPAATPAVAVPVDRPAVDPAGGAVVRRGPPRH